MKFLVIAICTVFLAGCQQLVSTCNALDDVYAHYDAVALTGAVSQRTMARVEFARTQANILCADPENATTVSLAAAAAAVYVATAAAFKEGGQLNDARVGYAKLENLKQFLEEARR